MDRLSRYHRRMSDVKAAADEHQHNLPPNHDPLDPGAWRQLKSAIIANEEFFGASGPIGIAPAHFTRVDTVLVSTTARQLSDAISKIHVAIGGTPLVGMFETTTLDEIARKVGVKRDAARICHDSVTKAGNLYIHDPPSIRQLVKDVALAIRYEEFLRRVSGAFLAHSASMPVGGMPADASTWERVIAGVDAAERLSLRVRNIQALEPVLCRQGGIDTEALNTAIDRATASHRKLDHSMEQCEEFISLSPPNETAIATGRRLISAMKEIVISATEALGHRLREVQKIIEVLRDESDAGISRLPDDVDAIAKLKAILLQSKEASSQLADLEITDFSASDKPRIQ